MEGGFASSFECDWVARVLILVTFLKYFFVQEIIFYIYILIRREGIFGFNRFSATDLKDQ